MTLYKKNNILGNFLFAIALVAVLALGVAIPEVNAATNRVTLACPYSAQTGRTIVYFNDTLLRSDLSAEESKAFSAGYLPAGNYKVSSFSYDGYDERVNMSQPNERYHIAMFGNNTLVSQTQSTLDLQDNVRVASSNYVTDNNLSILANVDTFAAVHMSYPDTSSPNSVVAGCVAFDLISTSNPDPVVTPVYPVCGSAANVSSATQPSYDLCSAGYVGEKGVTTGGKWYWACVGSNTNWTNDTTWCEAPKTTTQNQALNGSCTVSTSNVNVGDTVTWTASAWDGAGNYSFQWSGTDGLSSGNYTTSKSYSTAGTKTGTVTITSGGESIVRNCTTQVNSTAVNNLSVSCSADDSRVDVDDDVRWRATASGGNGSYFYNWSGTDGLYGASQNITWSYDDDGTKTAIVTVTSNGQTASDSCTVRVDEEDDNDDLRVSCYANPSNPQVGERMNWYADVSGGDGDYDYDWEGDDGLNSSSRSPSKTYNTSGTKEVEVTVRDGDGNRDTDTCTVRVGQNSVLAFSEYNQTPYQPAVYLSQVPYTGAKENWSLALFVLGLALFSAYVAYVVISYKKNNGELN